jgi:pimeloyl-ACP methyl ester carboxylesterase
MDLPLVLLLHSSVSSSRQWRKLQASLEGRYRTLSVDLLGYGETPYPHRAARPFHIEEELAHLERAIAGVDAPIHIAGHSYGGAVGIKFALRHPARVRSVYAHEPVLFRLLEPECHAEWNEIRSVATTVAGYIADANPGAAMETFLDYWSGPGTWNEIPTERREPFLRAAPKLLLDFEALLTDCETIEAYRDPPWPILITAGDRGPMPARKVASLLAEALPPESVRILSGWGHMAPLTHSGQVNAAIAGHLDRAEREPCPISIA